MKIGVFDSGIGGLAFFRELDLHYPSASRIYLGDHANLPYGEKKPEEIVKLTLNGVGHLRELGCTTIVIACNTASILAGNIVKNHYSTSFPTINVIDISSPTIEFLASPELPCTNVNNNEKLRVAVFATSATVRSNYFKFNISRFHPIEVQQLACGRLVHIIESAGSTDQIREYIHSTVARMTRLLSGLAPHVVILGCTHYSMVAGIFQNAIGNECEILRQEVLLMNAIRKSRILELQSVAPPLFERSVLTTGNIRKANDAVKSVSFNDRYIFSHAQPIRRSLCRTM